MDNNEIYKIDLEDIQDLVIQKKFVRINSDKYTENAFQYIKYLIDKERAILFDEDTHRIYTLGDYYGGDTLREDLLYFSKILSIDLDDNILNEINASKNSDTIAIKSKGPLNVNFSNGKYTTIELEYKLNDAINKNPFHINPNNEYRFVIDEDGKINLKEYIYPNIQLELEPLNANNYNFEQSIVKELTYNVMTSIDQENWNKFEILTYNCDLINHNINEHKITIRFYKYNNGEITFNFSDGINEINKTFVQKWYNQYIYGTYDGINFIESGRYNFVDNEIDSTFIINQSNIYYGYFMCTTQFKPIFVDNYTKFQGAWHKINNTFIDNIEYNVYITDNSGLGNNEWCIMNKNI